MNTSIDITETAAELVELAGVVECIDATVDRDDANTRRGAQVALDLVTRRLLAIGELLAQHDTEAAEEMVELAGVADCIDSVLDSPDLRARQNGQVTANLLSRRLLALADAMRYGQQTAAAGGVS